MCQIDPQDSHWGRCARDLSLKPWGLAWPFSPSVLSLFLPFLNPIFGCFLNFGLQKGFPFGLSFYGPEGIFLKPACWTKESNQSKYLQLWWLLLTSNCFYFLFENLYQESTATSFHFQISRIITLVLKSDGIYEISQFLIGESFTCKLKSLCFGAKSRGSK